MGEKVNRSILLDNLQASHCLAEISTLAVGAEMYLCQLSRCAFFVLL